MKQTAAKRAWWKILIPVLTVIVLIATAAEYVGDFTAEAEDVPDRPRRARRLQHRSSNGGGPA